MNSVRAMVASSIVWAVLASCLGANAQDASSAANIQQKVVAQYPLTKATADRSDIVTAGAVLEKGQTKEVVVAILGQPSKVVKLSDKEIDVYPDMKVTYVDDKIADVQ